MSENTVGSMISIDPDYMQRMIDQAVETSIVDAVDNLSQDPEWVARVDRLITQAITHRTAAALGSIDINSLVYQRVDENMKNIRHEILENFSSTGIDDQASTCQLTVMDSVTVVENKLTAADLEVVGSSVVKDLVVKGSINTDNTSWDGLKNEIVARAMNQLIDQWQTSLTKTITEDIEKSGINLDSIKIDNKRLIDGNRLSSSIVESNLQKTGTLQELTVAGETHLNDTVSVVRGRLGVNTKTPEMALSIWDEEVSITAGKFKSQQGYIGTARDQSLVLGTNRQAQVEIDVDGTVRIKKLRVAQFQIGHSTETPGWSGTKGDFVINANPAVDRPFAWVCLGAYKWLPLKAVE
jgi:hypothetical protein